MSRSRSSAFSPVSALAYANPPANNHLKLIPGLWTLHPDPHEWRASRTLPLAIGLHVATLVLIGLVMLLAQLFGWNLPLFDLAKLQTQPLEFVLVEAPEAPPRDPNTRNRAQQNSRSGGQVVPNQPKVQTVTKAGSPRPAAKASPSRPQQRQAPVARPTQPQPQAQPQPKQSPQPASQRKSSPAPTQTPKQTADPAAPKIKRSVGSPIVMPSPSGQANLPSGPVLSRGGGSSPNPSSSSANSGSQGAPSPSQLPGGPSSRPSLGSPGGQAGQGGTGSFNQFGSPGGGGGRAGVDALAEPNFGPYIAELQRRIKNNWRPPSDSQTKRIVAVFSVGRAGNLVGITIKTSSGTPLADQAAIQAIQVSAPFKPLPPNYRGNTIDVLFTFDYNVLSGSMR